MRIFFAAGLLAGLLDLASAMLLSLSMGRNPLLILKFIASGLYGKKAFEQGSSMLFIGFFLHICIAMAFVLFYALVPARIGWLQTHPLAGALGYGLFVYAVMNYLVLPLSRTEPRKTTLSFQLINLLILIIAIGLPSAYAGRF